MRDAGQGKVELEGSIQNFSLTEVVQFLGASGKTGTLRVVASNEGSVAGVICFDKGSVVHAAVDRAEGEEAFFELMRWTEGQFSFEPEVPAERKTVRQSSTNLLLEGARRLDDWAVLSEHIPDVELVPEFVLPDENDTGKQITLNTSEWVVLSKIDGVRTLKEVARAAALSDYHTCRLLYPLIANNLIRLGERSSR